VATPLLVESLERAAHQLHGWSQPHALADTWQIDKSVRRLFRSMRTQNIQTFIGSEVDGHEERVAMRGFIDSTMAKETIPERFA
jgi:hypothetical protein